MVLELERVQGWPPWAIFNYARSTQVLVLDCHGVMWLAKQHWGGRKAHIICMPCHACELSTATHDQTESLTPPCQWIVGLFPIISPQFGQD